MTAPTTAGPKVVAPNPWHLLRRSIDGLRLLWPVLPIIALAIFGFILSGTEFIFTTDFVICLVLAAAPILVPALIAATARNLCGPARHDLAADVIEALLVAGGWITSLSIAGALFHSLARYLPDKLSGTWLGAGAWPITIVASLLTFLACAFVTLRTPLAFARLRFAGTRHATAVVDALTAGIGWFMVVAVGMGMVHATQDIKGIRFLVALGLVAGFTAVVYLLSRLSLPKTGSGPTLWIVLPRELPDVRVVAGWSLSITKQWKRGPVTWLIPEKHRIAGSHAYFADRIGELAALHPAQAHSIDNWIRALPPAHHWRALKQRECHASPKLLQQFLMRHSQPEDSMVLLTRDEAEVREWMRTSAGVTTGIGWLGDFGLELHWQLNPSEIPCAWMSAAPAPVLRERCSNLLRDLHEISLSRMAALKPALKESGEQNAAEVVLPTRKVIFAGATIAELQKRSVGLPTILLEIRAELESAATRLGLGEQTLVVTQGASGSEIIFMEICRDRGIPFALVQPLPSETFIETFVTPAGDNWLARYRHVASGATTSYGVDPGESVTPERRLRASTLAMLNFALPVGLQSTQLIWLDYQGIGQLSPDAQELANGVSALGGTVETLSVGKPPVMAA